MPQFERLDGLEDRVDECHRGAEENRGFRREHAEEIAGIEDGRTEERNERHWREDQGEVVDESADLVEVRAIVSWDGIE